ncbi:hypothetical protein TSUD_28840 [Trifolium subterraneum]|uniref:Uncharacterized protein n=1 Tax=Trifolium subterraneum TaxID=3900 RepID=A0A2Z6P2Y8_TRISU|nr:hypothetical protein TSUD_28840 [Trifolium subterraneum]
MRAITIIGKDISRDTARIMTTTSDKIGFTTARNAIVPCEVGGTVMAEASHAQAGGSALQASSNCA